MTGNHNATDVKQAPAGVAGLALAGSMTGE